MIITALCHIIISSACANDIVYVCVCVYVFSYVSVH